MFLQSCHAVKLLLKINYETYLFIFDPKFTLKKAYIMLIQHYVQKLMQWYHTFYQFFY